MKSCTIISPFHNSFGISKSIRELVSVLLKMNYKLSTFDISNDFFYNPETKNEDLIKILNKTEIRDISVNEEIVLNVPLDRLVSENWPENYIPYFSIDVNSLPKQCYEILKSKDKILVYNTFTKNILIDCGLDEDRIHVVHPSINIRNFVSANPFPLEMKKQFSFLSVVDVSKRPEWIDVIRSFFNEFSFSDDVCLVLKAYNMKYNFYYQNEIAREIESLKKEYKKKTPPIVFIGYHLSDEEMSSLYASCNCYVKIYNTNLGITFAEAMAAGLFCIGPEKGGCRDLINHNNSFLIKKKKEKRIMNDTIYDGSTYNIFDSDHLSFTMRYVYDNCSELKEKTVKERKIILSEYDCNAVASLFVKSIK